MSARRRRQTMRGMTLVEAMLGIVLLAFAASGISALFVTGMKSLESADDRALVDSRLRSQLEELISRPIADLLSTGADSIGVTIRSKAHTLDWSAVRVDLDGDAVVEPNAIRIKVSIAGRSLRVILVDHGDRVVRIP